MSSSSSISLALALGIVVSAARPVGCQQLRQLEVGVHPAAADSIVPAHPSGLSLNLKSVGWAVSGSVIAGGAGLMVDQAYCQRHHGNEPSFLFGPCTFYASGGFAAGWFGGAFMGAALGAARVAHERGCPWRAAILRAVGGAAIGVAPGLSIVAGRPGKYPPSRSILIAAAPILGGIGAAAAVIGCQGK
jgi:hypothetical protein